MEMVVTAIVVLAGITIVWTIGRLVRVVRFNMRRKKFLNQEFATHPNSSPINEGVKLQAGGYFGEDGVQLGEVREARNPSLSLQDDLDHEEVSLNNEQLNESAVVETELPHPVEPRLFLDDSRVESHEFDNHENYTETQLQAEQTVVMADDWKANEVEHLHVEDELSTFDEPEATDRKVEEVTQFEEQLESEQELQSFDEINEEPESEQVEVAQDKSTFGRKEPKIPQNVEEPLSPYQTELFGRNGDDTKRTGSTQGEDNNEIPDQAGTTVPYTFRSGSVELEANNQLQYFKLKKSKDRNIDAIAWLPGEHRVVSRIEVLSAYRQCETKLTKPHNLLGVNPNNNNIYNIEEDEQFAMYSDLYLTMQLVDHEGPINSEESIWFQNLVLQMASTLSRNYQFSMPAGEFVREANVLAREIEFMRNEAVVVLSVAGPPLTERGLNYIAKECGFQQRASGVFFKDSSDNEIPPYELLNSDAGGHLVSAVVNNEVLSQLLVLSSNIPCVKNPGKAVAQMLDAAEELADRLDAEICDRNLASIDRAQISLMLTEIEKFGSEMIRRGIAPGGDTAIRLFGSSEADVKSQVFYPEH